MNMSSRIIRYALMFTLMVCVPLHAAEEKKPDKSEEKVAKQEVFDMSLEQLLNLRVTVASRRDEMVRDAPAVMTVVPRAEIEAFGARNLRDIINRLPSTQVLGHVGFYGNRTQMRGQPNSSMDRHTLILLNGRPVRENVNLGNNAYFYLGFPVSAIESIEIIRGPGSVLYGSNAFAAVINIKTRTASKGTTGGEASVTYGTYDTVDNTAQIVGCTEDGLHYLLSTRKSRTNGPRIEWTDSNGTRDSLNYSDDSDSVYFNASKDVHTFQVAYNRYVPGEFGTLGRHSDAIYISEVETFFADFGSAYQATDDISLHLNSTLNTFQWKGRNDGGGVFTRRSSTNAIFEPMLKYANVEDFNLVLGGTIEYDRFGGRELKNHDRYIHSMYLQADYQITDWLKPLIGLQHNKTENADGDFSRRAGLIFTPGEHWGGKLLYGEAFRRPSAVEEYLDSSFLSGNRELKPESIETFEAQVNYQNSVVQADITYFNSRQEVIEVDTNVVPMKFINQGGDLLVHGCELTTRVQLNQHWQTLGSWIVQTSDFKLENPKAETNFPDYMAKCGLSGNFEHFDFGVFNSYFSDGKRDPYKSFNNLQANLSFDLSRPLRLPKDRASLSFTADNILDDNIIEEKAPHLPVNGEDHEPRPHYNGRRLYVTLKVTW